MIFFYLPLFDKKKYVSLLIPVSLGNIIVARFEIVFKNQPLILKLDFVEGQLTLLSYSNAMLKINARCCYALKFQRFINLEKFSIT